jgi:hypothetical protein
MTQTELEARFLQLREDVVVKLVEAEAIAREMGYSAEEWRVKVASAYLSGDMDDVDGPRRGLHAACSTLRSVRGGSLDADRVKEVLTDLEGVLFLL